MFCGSECYITSSDRVNFIPFEPCTHCARGLFRTKTVACLNFVGWVINDWFPDVSL